MLEFKHEFEPDGPFLAGLCSEFGGQCRTTAMSGLFHSENGGRACWGLRGEAAGAWKWSVGVAAGGDGEKNKGAYARVCVCAFSR